MAKKIAIIGLLALSFLYLAAATDPASLQDFCVAKKSKHVRVNGDVCRDPEKVEAKHFFHKGLDKQGDTDNKFGSKVTPVTVVEIPGLNTLGVSMARIDIAPYGINPNHIHPRATELITVIEGSIEVGFVTSNPDNLLITKELQKGDVFVFPIGLMHFQRNIGYCNAVVLSVFSSQNPGVISVGKAVFASNPPINPEILAKAFQIDESLVEQVKCQLQD